MKTEYIKYPLIGASIGAARGGLIAATPEAKKESSDPTRTIGLNALVGGLLGLGLARLTTRPDKVKEAYKFFKLDRSKLERKGQVRKAWEYAHSQFYQKAMHGDRVSQQKLKEVNKHFSTILTKDQPFFKKLGSALLPDAMEMLIKATKPFYLKGMKLPKIKPLSLTRINKPMKLAELKSTNPTAQAEIERLVKEWLERKPPKGVRKEVLAP